MKKTICVPSVLIDMFLPQIGRDGLAVHLALCVLIPEAEANPLFQLSVRIIAKKACTSTGTTHRVVQQLAALGMVKVISAGRGTIPARYELADLREIAQQGQKLREKE